MSIPKVFISYSHDSQKHKKWVLDIATRLRKSGVNAIIDQWELRPGDDLPHFMETHLSSADYVVMVCTDNYVEKANSGAGGVGYEKMIITSELLSSIDSNKVVPIIRQYGTHKVPTFLTSKLFINFSIDEEYEFNFDELVRTFHDAPLYIKPEIGNNPFTTIEVNPPQKSGDALRELMQIVIEDYESGSNWITYDDLVYKIGISRIMLDMLLEEATNLELIYRDSEDVIQLNSNGKKYAIQHGLVGI